MKKNKKYTALILAVMLLLAGCGDNGPSNSHITADTGKGTSGEMEGQVVSYGPITLTLPTEYTVEEKFLNSPIYYATDQVSEEAEYKPNIRLLTDYGTVTSNADVNKENFIADEKELLSNMEDSEFQEMVSYEETELGGYKVIKALSKEIVYGRPLVVVRCNIYEKVGSEGVFIYIKYDSLESDKEHLSDFEACLDSINLKPGLRGGASDYRRVFYFRSGSTGSSLAVSGNYVNYGPLQMKLPDGYNVEDDAAIAPVFSGADGSSFQFRFTEGSCRLMSDKAYAEKLLKKELEGTGITDASMVYHQAIRISGYDGYEMEIQASVDGQKMTKFVYVIFETADEDMAPMFEVAYTASGEAAKTMAKEVDEAFNSIRLDCGPNVP